jgi:hypothetical protein
MRVHIFNKTIITHHMRQKKIAAKIARQCKWALNKHLVVSEEVVELWV